MTTQIVCVFPGQGSQTVGMGRDLWEVDDAVKALYQEANDTLGYDLQRLCFQGPEEELQLTQNAQPAILVHSIATWMCATRRGLQPVLLAGHSLGEYSALVASGALGFGDAVRLVHQRGRFMQEAVAPGTGSMAAVLGVPRQDVETLCRELEGDGVLQLANYNDPGQIVIAGEASLVATAMHVVKTRRLGKAIALKVSAPFHCRMLQPAAERLSQALSQVTFRPWSIPVLSNVTATPHPTPEAIADLLIQQVCAPVRWEEAMRYAVAQGCDALLEVGPGKALAGMMKRIAPEVQVLALETFLP